MQNVRHASATISWATEEGGVASAAVTSPDGETREFPAFSVHFPAGQGGASNAFHRHWARLEGLERGTEYRYAVRIDGRDAAPGGEFRFRTAGQKDFSFLALGDSGTGSEEQKRLAALLQREPSALVIHTGDLAYPTGTYESYDQNYFDVYQESMQRAPFFPVPGNHDYYEFGAAPYRALHDMPRANVPDPDAGRYYSFDWGDVHFVALDSNVALEEAAAGTGGMLRWLEADLAATEKFWRIAVFHHPPYAWGPNMADPLAALVREKIVPILERFHVPLVYSGHEHSYQRTVRIRGGREAGDGAVYLTTGGGGAPLYDVIESPLLAMGRTAYHYLRTEVSGRRMKVTAVDMDGKAFDSFVLEPAPVVKGEIVNAASGTRMIGRGGLVSIYGWQFTPEELTGAGDMRVRVGELAATVVAASATQLNVAIPAEARGVQTVEVRTPAGTATAEIEIRDAAPALFAAGIFEGGRTQVTEKSPCRPGSRVDVFLTGVGEFAGPVNLMVDGAAIDSRTERWDGMAGVQRLSFTVPEKSPEGPHAMAVEAGGIWSNTVALYVRRVG